MTNEFTDHIETFISSLNENLPEIYYQAFDFSNVNDSRTQFMKLNYDKNNVSFLNLEMVGREFRFFKILCYFIRLRMYFKYLLLFIVLLNKIHLEILVWMYRIDCQIQNRYDILFHLRRKNSRDQILT
jgi:hypothetical protein